MADEEQGGARKLSAERGKRPGEIDDAFVARDAPDVDDHQGVAVELELPPHRRARRGIGSESRGVDPADRPIGQHPAFPVGHDAFADEEIALRCAIGQQVGRSARGQTVRRAQDLAHESPARGPHLAGEGMHPLRNAGCLSRPRSEQAGFRREGMDQREVPPGKQCVELPQGEDILQRRDGPSDRQREHFDPGQRAQRYFSGKCYRQGHGIPAAQVAQVRREKCIDDQRAGGDKANRRHRRVRQSCTRRRNPFSIDTAKR